ncbi:MAG TPA: GntR family transcriptional regulator, partial [Acidimicrobiia bacterium]|nr:GntR family transcriptional regulator [Acidimicrobiia bacterium]
ILAFGFVEAPPSVADALHIDRGSDVLRVERVNLADDEPFALVTVWVRADVGADVSRADVERSPFYDLLPLRGVELGSVHQTITAEVASAATARLLACAPGAPLLLSRRVTLDAAGVATLFSEHRYPADRTTFEIEFSLRAGALQHA